MSFPHTYGFVEPLSFLTCSPSITMESGSTERTPAPKQTLPNLIMPSDLQ